MIFAGRKFHSISALRNLLPSPDKNRKSPEFFNPGLFQLFKKKQKALTGTNIIICLSFADAVCGPKVFCVYAFSFFFFAF